MISDGQFVLHSFDAAAAVAAPPHRPTSFCLLQVHQLHPRIMYNDKKKSSFLSVVLAISTDTFLSESEAQLHHKFLIAGQELRRCRSHSL